MISISRTIANTETSSLFSVVQLEPVIESTICLIYEIGLAYANLIHSTE
jgi:hypothetical protein